MWPLDHHHAVSRSWWRPVDATTSVHGIPVGEIHRTDRTTAPSGAVSAIPCAHALEQTGM
jgi:hypothetical protein